MAFVVVLGTIEKSILRFLGVSFFVRNYRNNNFLHKLLFISVSCSIFVCRKKCEQKCEQFFQRFRFNAKY